MLPVSVIVGASAKMASVWRTSWYLGKLSGHTAAPAVEFTGLIKEVLPSTFQRTHYGTAANSISEVQGGKALMYR